MPLLPASRCVLWGIFLLEVLAKKDPLLCDTQKCVEESERLKEFIDEEVNPCDDFHMFACGKFLRNTEIPKTETYVSALTKLDGIIKRQIKSLLVDAPQLPMEPNYVTMARDLYHACVRTDLGNKSVSLLLDMMKQAGGWPLLEGSDWDKDQFDWMDAVFKFHEFGFRKTNIFDFDIIENFEKPNEHIIKIEEVSLGLDSYFLIDGPKSDEIEAYIYYLVELSSQLGVDELNVRQELSHILYFEIELARMLTEGKEKNILPPAMTLEELKGRHSDIDWDRYFEYMLGNTTKLKPDERIVVNKISFIRKLEEILKRTAKRTLANFLMLRAAREAASFLSDGVRQLDFDFTRMYHGRSTPEPRWKQCAAYTENSLNLAVGSLYVRKFVTKEAKTNVKALVERIHMELSHTLKDLPWLEGSSREKALRKLKMMKKLVAYPKEILDEKNVKEYYKGVNLNKETWLEQHLELAKFQWSRDIRKLRSPVIKHDWRNCEIARLRVGFNYLENSLSVSAGIMQEGFFSEVNPRYLNFGAIGSKIGHEMIHGFDYKGQHYDERGHFQEWWEKETVFKFMETTKCVFNEAANYTVTGTNLTIDAKNTLRENVADHGGIGLAYKAFKTWMSETHVDRIKLIGFEHYTAEQMFWISAATTFCVKYSEDRLRAEVLHGEQSTPAYRINVPFRNQKGFGEDFKCSEGSYMNPVHRCNVWRF